MTLAPDSANVLAIARPIPRDAPVTSATLPLSETSISPSYRSYRAKALLSTNRGHQANFSDAATFKRFNNETPALNF